MAVEVVASVLIPEDATSRVTNTFRFLFADAIAKVRGALSLTMKTPHLRLRAMAPDKPLFLCTPQDTRKSVARVLPSTTGEAKLCAEALLRAGLPLVLD